MPESPSSTTGLSTPVGRASVARRLIRSASLPFSLNRFVDFLPVDGDIGGSINAQPHFIPTDVHDRDHDVVADDNAFVSMS